MLHPSKDRRICPEDGGGQFLHPVVDKLKQEEVTHCHFPEESNHELIGFSILFFFVLYCFL
jgi:hypothetical protein